MCKGIEPQFRGFTILKWVFSPLLRTLFGSLSVSIRSQSTQPIFFIRLCVFFLSIYSTEESKRKSIPSIRNPSVIIPPRNMYEQRRVPLLVRNKSKSELIRYYHHCIYFPTFWIRALNKIMSFESITSWFRIRFFSIFLNEYIFIRNIDIPDRFSVLCIPPVNRFTSPRPKCFTGGSWPALLRLGLPCVPSLLIERRKDKN